MTGGFSEMLGTCHVRWVSMRQLEWAMERPHIWSNVLDVTLRVSKGEYTKTDSSL